MLERMLSVIVMTLAGGIGGILLGGVAYGVAFTIGRTLGIGPIFIISGVLAFTFFVIALVDEWRLR